MHCDESISSYVVVVIIIILRTIIEFNVGLQGQSTSLTTLVQTHDNIPRECCKYVNQRICYSINSQKIYFSFNRYSLRLCDSQAFQIYSFVSFYVQRMAVTAHHQYSVRASLQKQK